LIVEAKMPEAASGHAVEAAGDKPVYAIAISPAKAVRLKPFLPRLACLFMNTREAKALTGATDPLEAARKLRNAGLAAGAITAGGKPVTGFDGEGLFCITPPAPTRIADVTGAGDALAGTTVAHLAKGASMRVSLRFGVAAAVLTVASEGAAPAFSAEEFETVLKLVPEPEAVP
jgi:sugar/nucleoside kinase (ribokinase family)